MSAPWTLTPRQGFQHLLRETDAVGLDPARLIDEALSVGADTYIAMCGGFSAWYPQAGHGQAVNPHLSGDFLDRLVKAARQAGMRLLLRIDLSKAQPATVRPDCVVRRADGSIATVWDMPQTCGTGPVWQEDVLAILDEILDRHAPDGFFFNYFTVPRCHCARCAARVLAETGAPVPADGLRTPAHEAWRQRTLAATARRLADHLHARDPALAFVPYHHVRDAWDLPAIAAAADLWSAQISNPLAVNPVDPQPVWPYWPAEEALLGRALKPGVPPLLVQSGSGFFASRQVPLPPGRFVAGAVQAAAHGASVVAAVNGRLGPAGAGVTPGIARLGGHLARHAEWYDTAAPRARIGLLRSEASRLWGVDAGRAAGDPAGGGHVAEFRGLFTLVAGLRHPLSVVASGAITAEALAGLDVLILPAVSCLAAEDCRAIDAFAHQGGTLIVTGDTGACGPDGSPNAAPPLAALPSLPGAPCATTGGYFALGEEGGALGLDGLPHLGADGPLWQPETEGGAWRRRLGLLGPFTNNAPEYTAVEGPEGPPGLLTRSHGAGTVHWLPWRPGAVFGRTALPEYRRLLGALLEGAAGPAPLRLRAGDAVQAALMAHPRGALLHLLNAAVPDGQPLVAPPPLAGFGIDVHLPVASATDLSTGAALPVRRRGAWSEVAVPALADFAAIALVEDVA